MSGEQQRWEDAMARWDGLVDAAAERARQRFELAKAALTGLLASPNATGTHEAFGIDAARYADATLAALDRTAGPTSESVPPSQPPPMMTEWNEAAMRWESRSMCVTTSAGTKLMGMCVQYYDEENPGKYGPVWVCAGDRMTVIHGVVAWEPITPSPATRPGGVE